MREDLMDRIADREGRIQDAVEFFGWPRPLVECMFEHSKDYFEGPWDRFYPYNVHEYYAAGFYTIRQLSYSKPNIFTKGISAFLDTVSGRCMDYGCGVGDYVLYLALSGIDVVAYEYPGVPLAFLKYRLEKYGVNAVIREIPSRYIDIEPVDYALLISVIDHVEAPILFAETVCSRVSKKIHATPCIDETYDRPTHIKEILKDVPKAFEVIHEHNRTVQ